MPDAFVLFYTPIHFWKQCLERGDAPDVLPYGLNNLERFGVQISYSDIAQNKYVKLPLRPLEKWVFGCDVVQPLLLIRRMRRSDVVLSTLDRQGLFLGWLRANRLFGLHKVPHVFISTSLAQEVQSASKARMRFLRKALSAVDRVVFYSSNQADVFAERLGVPKERLRCVPFGANPDIFRPTDAEPKDYIVSVGWDKGRDYGTLIRAADRLAAEVVLVCAPSNLPGLDLPKNVRVEYKVPISRLKTLYAESRAVVVPTHDFAYPTGQTVVLEAMAMGKPVIATSNQGMREYIRHGSTGLLVPPADPQALGAAIRQVLDDASLAERLGRAARRSVEERFNTLELSRQLAEVIKEVTHGN